MLLKLATSDEGMSYASLAEALGLSPSQAHAAVARATRDALGFVKTPEGYRGTDASYFEGVAANNTTQGRVHGSLQSFVDVGVTRYELVNPGDSRTSRICQHLNGKVYEIDRGVAQAQAVTNARTPKEVKAAHPWRSFAELTAVSPSKGDQGVGDSNALAPSGVAIPPFHFRCRTVIDVTF